MGKCIQVVTEEVLLVLSSGSHILLLDDIKGLEILKLTKFKISLKYPQMWGFVHFYDASFVSAEPGQ